MTGTALTEANEFWEIYKLDVVAIPTNKQIRRTDYPDRIFRTEREKFNAVIEEIEDCWKRGQPVLVGTRSIEKSEALAAMLRRKGIPHQVLNAKYHEREAQIIAQAGRKAAVTIATNMAGRGTDILLGGNPQDKEEAELVKTAGGLHVLGSERHEARRIDNQLRGRTGRQGDPGSSRFYLSLEDELMRLFGSERISGILEKVGMKEGEDIQHPWINAAVERAQKKVEAMNFDIRKQVLDYDNVMNKQREAIYHLRNQILEGIDIPTRIEQMIEESIEDHLYQFTPKGKDSDEWDTSSLKAWLKNAFAVDWTFEAEQTASFESLQNQLSDVLKQLYKTRNEELGPMFLDMQKNVILHVMDNAWVEHLTYLEQLRRGIFLRAYGQKDPLIEFQKEGHRIFESMMLRIRDSSLEYIFRMSKAAMESAREVVRPQAIVTQKEDVNVAAVAQRTQEGDGESGDPAASTSSAAEIKTHGLHQKAAPITVEKVGRNDPCPCGSGKKYKKCCGK